jgi:hypothetical protein
MGFEIQGRPAPGTRQSCSLQPHHSNHIESSLLVCLEPPNEERREAITINNQLKELAADAAPGLR